MRKVAVQARSLEGALERAAAELGVSKDQLRWQLVGMKKGFLGILGRGSVSIEAWVEEDEGQRARAFLERVLELGGWRCSVVLRASGLDRLSIEVVGEGAKEVIGREGEVLDALQYMVEKVVNKGKSQRIRVVLDADGFRERREEELRRRAMDAARRARSGSSVVLGPLSARDRRIIHLTLRDEPGITTRSVGEGPMRRVVVSVDRTGRGEGAAREAR